MEISIIVPVYNVEKYLNQCLDSIVSQEFSYNFEVICVNDGSTDGSKLILEKYTKKYSNVKLVEQKNCGLSAARNTGFRNSIGKYIMFIDSDDYLENNNVISMLYNEVTENNLDFIIADFEYDYEDKNKNYRIDRETTIKNCIMEGRELFDKGIKSNSIMSIVWNKLYSREFLDKNNLYFYEGILYEDMEFTPKAYYLAERVKYIDEKIIMYRQREGSIMSTINEKRVVDFIKVADSLQQFNRKYQSETIRNFELYQYVSVIRKINKMNDREEIDKLNKMLRERKVINKFNKSKDLKYRIYGVLYYLRLTRFLKEKI